MTIFPRSGVGEKNCRRFGQCYLRSISVIDQIRGMPLHEKLLTMEALWEDLAGREEDVEVPEWHKDVLDHRERLLAEGKAHSIGWEQAKKEVMDSNRC